MLTLPGSVRVWLAATPIDMRKGFDALAAFVREALGCEPMSGDLFVFRNRRGHVARILFWDRSGYCMLTKRLECGTFRVPCEIAPGTARIEVDPGELAMMLEGFDVRGTRRRPLWKPRRFDPADLDKK